MELDTALEGYSSTRERLTRAFNSPGELGDIALKMGLYGTHIGDHLGALKAEYEQERAKKYLHNLKLNMSATQAENLARSDNADLKGQIARIELAHKNLWGLVSIIQSRLRGLEKEASNSM